MKYSKKLQSILMALGVTMSLSAHSQINTLFELETDFSISGTRHVTASDFDGDGFKDLAFGGLRKGITLLQNSGSNPISQNSFTVIKDLPTQDNTMDLKAGDIDGDGKQDIVLVFDKGFTVYRNGYTSDVLTISTFEDSSNFFIGTNNTSVGIADLDTDGKLDVVVSDADADAVYIFTNISTAGNVDFAPFVKVSVGNGPQDLVLVDLNLDGKIDIATGNAGDVSGNKVSVLGNNTSANVLEFLPVQGFNTSTGPMHIIAADLNNDNKPELITSGYNQAGISVLPNNSTLTTFDENSFGDAFLYPTSLSSLQTAVYDLDGDGWKDIVTWSYQDHYIYVLRNSENKSELSATTYTVTNNEQHYNGYGIIVEDLNKDESPEIITSAAVILSKSATITSTDKSINNVTKIYPNPTSGNVSYELDAYRNNELKIINSFGMEVQKVSNAGEKGNLNLSHLPKGVYLMMIKSEDGKESQVKIVLE